MKIHIPNNLRALVANRAKFRCEYCRLPADASFFPFHIDHIVSLKHGGETHSDNLAYCCQICNLNKGSDIATFLPNTNTPVRFFNPRTDAWPDHFGMDQSGAIYSKSEIGAATIRIFGLNHPESIIERKELLEDNRLQ